MRKYLCNAQLHKVVSILAILTFVGIIMVWPQNGNIIRPNVDPLVYSLAVIHNSSTISKSEQKKQRTMTKLRDEIDKVLKWREKDENLKNIEDGLARARAFINEAKKNANANNNNINSSIYIEDINNGDYVPQANIYKNGLAFYRSYSMMEKMFKIFIYKPPLFHYGPCKNIYSIEGFFIESLEANSHFRTEDPNHAHVFFLPFSVVMILDSLFDPIVRDKAVLERTIVDYVGVISNKHAYWNRSLGADHFMLSCHDWGPRATWYHPLLYFHSIRALCNANTSENFNPKKDVSIPEINLKTGEIPTPEPGLPPSNRTTLAFFAGRVHGHIRPILLKHWKLFKDKDIQVFDELPKNMSYDFMMKSSKFCICPSGFEVASPRVVESIYAECVPVLISQSYVLPFSDVLDWDRFSVRVSVNDIPNLRRILSEIPYKRYLDMHDGVKKVKRHFLVNYPPKRYDVFHMIVHSVWLRRLNVRVHS